MNNQELDQDNNKNKEPQISIELDDSVIKAPLSTFNNTMGCLTTERILKKQNNEKNIIGLHDLEQIECFKKKYELFGTQFKALESIETKLERNLKRNKFAQPKRCHLFSCRQQSKLSTIVKITMNAVENSKKKYQTFTISNTGDDNIIDMIGLGNDTQNLEVECKLAPKSKTNVSIPDLKTNDNNKVLPINTEAAKTLSNEEFLSTTIHKRKHGPKSKTKVPLNAENEETPEKIMRLNECKVINNKESNTINLLYSKSVKKLKLPKKYNHNLKTSNLEYPPPYPITPPFNNKPSWKNVPPIPKMTIEVLENKVIITCNMNLTSQMAKIKMYELFVCQETDAPPNISMWKKMANLKACKLPMICELEKFDLGYIYDFALRAVDIHNRRGPFAVRKTKI